VALAPVHVLTNFASTNQKSPSKAGLAKDRHVALLPGCPHQGLVGREKVLADLFELAELEVFSGFWPYAPTLLPGGGLVAGGEHLGFKVQGLGFRV